MVHQGFNSFSKFSSRFFPKELKHYSSYYPECNFFLPYLWRWYYVLLDNSPSLLRDSQVFKSDIFKSIFFSLFKRSFQPSISSLELSWYRFHLKPSLRNVAILVLINDPSYLFFILVEQAFISSLISSKQLFSLVAEFHLKF